MPDPVITRAEGGAELVRPAEDASLLGATVVDPSAMEADTRRETRRRMFDDSGHAATTFAEGVVDALSLGLIRETGEAADLRRDVNSGWAMAGNVLGFAAGMAGGPVRAVTHGAEAAGRSAAKVMLRSGEGSIVSRAAQEAAAGAALGGGQAFGHAMMDSIIEDKEFTSEAILHEVKLGGIIGGVGGVLLGGLAKAARKDVTKQGGILGDVDEAIQPHYEATRAYDAVVQRHAAEVGVLRELHAVGDVPEAFLAERVDALSRVKRAKVALDNIDVRKAVSGTDDVAYRKFQRIATHYRAAVGELDNVMQSMRPNPRAGIDALNELVDSLPPIKDRAPVESFEMPSSGGFDTPPSGVRAFEEMVDGAGPLPPTSAVDDLNMSEAKIARMKATIAGNAGERAKFKDMANGGRLVEPGEVTAPPAAFEGGKRRADVATGEIPQSGLLPATRRATDHAPIAQADDLPDIHNPDATPHETPREAPVRGPKADGPSWEQRFDQPPQLPGAPDALPSKPRPLDAAEARVQQVMADLVAKTGGRLDSAGALGILERSGITPAVDNVGAYMDQVYAMRKAGLFAADEARGVATPLRSAMTGALGGALGGPLGAVAAVAGELMYLKRGGRLAAASGRLMGTVAKAAESLLTSNRVRVAAGALAGASANNAWAYSDKGPIKDPVERIQEIQFLAANPDHIRERVADTAKDLADQPQLLAALQDRAVNQMQRLALRAPAIMFDKLGRALMPPGGKMRGFYEYENAVHDLPALLKAVASGTVTRPQVSALQENWISVHVKMASALLADPERLRDMSREVLRAVEAITGAPLTNAADPMWLARQTAAWVPPAPPANPQAPQAFNINPSGAPTPSQANATGRAPGN